MVHFVYAKLTVNGTDVESEPIIIMIGGEDVAKHIEVAEIRLGISMGSPDGARISSGHRAVHPVQLTMKWGPEFAIFYDAASTNKTVAGTIKVFDVNPEDGTNRLRQTIELEGARILRIDSVSPHAELPDTANLHPYSVVALIPHSIHITDPVKSQEAHLLWNEQA